jgi:hypothetical protein
MADASELEEEDSCSLDMGGATEEPQEVGDGVESAGSAIKREDVSDASADVKEDLVPPPRAQTAKERLFEERRRRLAEVKVSPKQISHFYSSPLFLVGSTATPYLQTGGVRWWPSGGYAPRWELDSNAL